MDYLSDVKINKAFKIREGVFVHSYRNLLIQLKLMSDSEFRYEFHDGADFVKWISKNFGDEKLLLELELANTKRSFIRVLEKRINYLEMQKGEKKITPSKLNLPFYVNVVFFIVFVAVLLSFLRYAYIEDRQNDELNGLNVEEQFDSYADRIAYLEKQNIVLKENLSNQFFELEENLSSPKNRVALENVKLNDSAIIIYVDSAVLAEFTDTDSMVPVLDYGAKGIEIIPLSELDLRVGDIISYKLEDGSIVIHRIVEMGSDESGWYAFTKGDNNLFRDREKVRFTQVQRVLIGILY